MAEIEQLNLDVDLNDSLTQKRRKISKIDWDSMPHPGTLPRVKKKEESIQKKAANDLLSMQVEKNLRRTIKMSTEGRRKSSKYVKNLDLQNLHSSFKREVNHQQSVQNSSRNLQKLAERKKVHNRFKSVQPTRPNFNVGQMSTVPFKHKSILQHDLSTQFIAAVDDESSKRDYSEQNYREELPTLQQMGTDIGFEMGTAPTPYENQWKTGRHDSTIKIQDSNAKLKRTTQNTYSQMRLPSLKTQYSSKPPSKKPRDSNSGLRKQLKIREKLNHIKRVNEYFTMFSMHNTLHVQNRTQMFISKTHEGHHPPPVFATSVNNSKLEQIDQHPTASGINSFSRSPQDAEQQHILPMKQQSHVPQSMTRNSSIQVLTSDNIVDMTADYQKIEENMKSYSRKYLEAEHMQQPSQFVVSHGEAQLHTDPNDQNEGQFEDRSLERNLTMELGGNPQTLNSHLSQTISQPHQQIPQVKAMPHQIHRPRPTPLKMKNTSSKKKKMVNPWEPNLTSSQKLLEAIQLQKDEEKYIGKVPTSGLSGLSRGASNVKKEGSMPQLNLISKKQLTKSPSPEKVMPIAPGSELRLGNIDSVQKLDFLPLADETIMKHLAKHQSLHNEIEKLKQDLQIEIFELSKAHFGKTPTIKQSPRLKRIMKKRQMEQSSASHSEARPREEAIQERSLSPDRTSEEEWDFSKLMEIIHMQDDEDRRVLKANTRKLIDNSVLTQGNEIFKAQSALESNLSNYSEADQEQAEQAKASKQAQKDLQNLFRKGKKSLKKYLEDLFIRQDQQMKEEEIIIDRILRKMPELRNTTARRLKFKNEGRKESRSIYGGESQRNLNSTNKSGKASSGGFKMTTATLKDQAEAHALMLQLEQFYERAEKQKQEQNQGAIDNEFSLEDLYGKRSTKELQFIKQMEKFNKTDHQQQELLDSLIKRWKTGVGRKRRRGTSTTEELQSFLSSAMSKKQFEKRQQFQSVSKRLRQQNKNVLFDEQSIVTESSLESSTELKVKKKKSSRRQTKVWKGELGIKLNADLDGKEMEINDS